MKSYPSISHHNKGTYGQPVYVFDKVDGSNIRAEWSKKNGWYKFGTKTQLIDESSPFAEAITIFNEKYAEGLANVFKQKYRDTQNFVAFLEFYGENSFAGTHVAEPHDLLLFDVSQYKRGMIPPKEFIENFGHLGIPTVYSSPVAYGDYLIEVIKHLCTNTEGVVCKWTVKKQVKMCKIKTKWWLEKLRKFNGDKAVLDELNGDKDLYEVL